MKKPLNPFSIHSYIGPDYFCDRVEETQQIISAIENGRSVTLYAIRRLGKTALIHHVFHSLKKKKDYIVVYLDILHTRTQGQFINLLTTAVLREIEKSKDNFWRSVIKMFSRYRPKISFDPYTGSPAIELDIETDQEASVSLEILFDLISKEKKTIVIAIDEFQQIIAYPNSAIDALLRGYLQSITNLRFIFSGSQRHLLLGLFTDTQKPLFRTTQMLQLDKIPKDQYQRFLSLKFKKGNKEISQKLLGKVLDWNLNHTYYVQYFCNQLFAFPVKHISQNHFYEVEQNIFIESESIYYNYKRLLSKHQWNLLRAIGKETSINQPTSKDFIYKHELGAESTVRQSLRALLDKSMIYDFIDVEGDTHYFIYDVFLSRWIEKKL